MRRNSSVLPTKPKPRKTPTTSVRGTPEPPKTVARHVARSYALGERNPDTMRLESDAENRRATQRWNRIRASVFVGGAKYTGHGG